MSAFDEFKRRTDRQPSSGRDCQNVRGGFLNQYMRLAHLAKQQLFQDLEDELRQRDEHRQRDAQEGVSPRLARRVNSKN